MPHLQSWNLVAFCRFGLDDFASRIFPLFEAYPGSVQNLLEISSFGQNLSRNVRKSSPKSHDVRPRDFVTGSNSTKNLGGGNSIIFFMFTPILGEYFQFDEHIFQMGLVQPPTRNSFPRMDSFTDASPFDAWDVSPVDTPWRLGGKLYVAGGYGPQEFCWQQKMRPELKIQMISDLVWGKS